jgi:hypothetical protein
MPDPQPVHLSIPLRRTPTGELATDPQDSDAEVDACVFAIANTPLGWRIDLPEFGTPRATHMRGGLNAGQLERTIALWEPRADIIGLRQTGRLRDLAHGVQVAELDIAEG